MLRAALDGGRGVLDRTFLKKAVRMRSVRCDVCGAKALVAASQCPKCSHLFDVRDGFGELLPLAYCSSCESYYPAHLGSCKWCGTMPESEPHAPLIWKRAAIGGLVAIAWFGGFLMLREPRRKPSHTKTAARAQPKPSATKDSVIAIGEWVPVDSTPPADPVMGDGGVSAGAAIVPVAARSEVPAAATPTVPTVTAPDVIVPQGGTHAFPRSSAPLAPYETSYPPPPTPSVPSAKGKMRPVSPWVASVAHSWVIVRTDASQDSRIVASVGPDSRVMLGEARGSWRRLRARDIIGWVDLRRSSFTVARGASRPNGLAAR
jgi:hypothetical protein